MVNLSFLTCSCPCWPRSSSNNQLDQQQSNSQYQSNHSESDVDERTPLITNPPQFTPSPHLHVVDTAQQEADEAAANQIVNRTVRCLVDVYSQAPFSHLRIQESHQPEATSDLHHTPDGSSSTWRAYDPPICPPASSKACTLILGFDELSSSSDLQFMPNHVDHNQRATHQRSFHSLKTIINHNQSTRQNGKSDQDSSTTQLINKDSHPPPVSPPDSSRKLNSSTQPSSNSSEATPHHSRQNSLSQTSCSTQFNTINSFQTAIDDTHSESDLPDYLNQSTHTLPELDQHHTRLIQKPEFVRNLWNHHDQSSSVQLDPPPLSDNHQSDDLDRNSIHLPEQESDFLTDDATKLSEMISNGFQLKDTGPILEEL